MFDITFHLVRRGRENLREQTKDTFAIAVDSQNRRYVYQAVDELHKNHPKNDGPQDSTTDGRMYEQPGSLCPVKTFELYLSKLHPELKFPVSSHLDSDNQRRPPQCIGGCCGSELSEPYQPNMDYSKATMKVYSSQSRAFRREWFVDHAWLTFCTSQNKVFCFYCCYTASRNLLGFSKKSEDAFTTRGFDNWKKAKQKFEEHEKSQLQSHREAVMKYEAVQRPSVSAQINMQVSGEQLTRRKGFLKQLSF